MHIFYILVVLLLLYQNNIQINLFSFSFYLVPFPISDHIENGQGAERREELTINFESVENFNVPRRLLAEDGEGV